MGEENFSVTYLNSILIGVKLSTDMINNKARYNRLMQNTVRWRSDQFQPTNIWNPWSSETDANLEDSSCTAQVLIFFPMVTLVWIPIVMSKEPDLAPVTKKMKLTKIRIP